MSEFLANFLAAQGKGVNTGTGIGGGEGLTKAVGAAYSDRGKTIPPHMLAASDELAEIQLRRQKFQGAKTGAVGAATRFGYYDPVKDAEREQAIIVQMSKEAAAARQRAAQMAANARRARSAQAASEKQAAASSKARTSQRTLDIVNGTAASPAQSPTQSSVAKAQVVAEVEVAKSAAQLHIAANPDALDPRGEANINGKKSVPTKASAAAPTGVAAPKTAATPAAQLGPLPAVGLPAPGVAGLSLEEEALAMDNAYKYMQDRDSIIKFQKASREAAIEQQLGHMPDMAFIDILSGSEATREQLKEMTGISDAELTAYAVTRGKKTTEAMNQVQEFQGMMVNEEVGAVYGGLDEAQINEISAPDVSPAQLHTVADTLGVSYEAVLQVATETREHQAKIKELAAKQQEGLKITGQEVVDAATIQQIQFDMETLNKNQTNMLYYGPVEDPENPGQLRMGPLPSAEGALYHVSRDMLESALDEKLERRQKIQTKMLSTQMVTRIGTEWTANIIDVQENIDAYYGGHMPSSLKAVLEAHRNVALAAVAAPAQTTAEEVADAQLAFITTLPQVLEDFGLGEEEAKSLTLGRFTNPEIADKATVAQVNRALDPQSFTSVGTQILVNALAQVTESTDPEVIGNFIMGTDGDVSKDDVGRVQAAVVTGLLREAGTAVQSAFLADQNVAAMLTPEAHNELSSMLQRTDSAVKDFELVAMFEQQQQLLKPGTEVGPLTARMAEMYLDTDSWYSRIFPQETRAQDSAIKAQMLGLLGLNSVNIGFDEIDEALRGKVVDMARKQAMDSHTVAEKALARARQQAAQSLLGRDTHRIARGSLELSLFLNETLGDTLDSGRFGRTDIVARQKALYQMTVKAFEIELANFVEALGPSPLDQQGP